MEEGMVEKDVTKLRVASYGLTPYDLQLATYDRNKGRFKAKRRSYIVFFFCLFLSPMAIDSMSTSFNHKPLSLV